MKNRGLAPIMVLLAGIFWGMLGVFVRRLSFLGLASMDIVALRAVATTIMLGIFLLIYDRKKLKIRIKDIWCFIGTGVCSITFFNFCYFKAITIASLSVAAILLYTAPAIVMVLSALLFREKFTIVKLISLVLTFVGCVFVTGVLLGDSVINSQGIMLGLGAGLGYALYSIFGRYALEKGYDSLTISFYTFLFAIVGTAPFADYGSMSKICTKDFTTVLFCIVFGLISTVLPYILYTAGLKGMENGKASIIASIEPVTASLMGAILYKERLSALEILGVVLVLGAIAINNINLNNKVKGDN